MCAGSTARRGRNAWMDRVVGRSGRGGGPIPEHHHAADPVVAERVPVMDGGRLGSAAGRRARTPAGARPPSSTAAPPRAPQHGGVGHVGPLDVEGHHRQQPSTSRFPKRRYVTRNSETFSTTSRSPRYESSSRHDGVRSGGGPGCAPSTRPMGAACRAATPTVCRAGRPARDPVTGTKDTATSDAAMSSPARR